MSLAMFNLPDVGEGLTEAEIVSWKVSPGDTVTVNQVICEIETAKSIVELPCPFAGTVEELLAKEDGIYKKLVDMQSEISKMQNNFLGAEASEEEVTA